MSTKVYSHLHLNHVKSEPIEAIPVGSYSSRDLFHTPQPLPSNNPKYTVAMSHSAGTTPITNDLMEINGVNHNGYGTMDNEDDDPFPNTSQPSSNRTSMKKPQGLTISLGGVDNVIEQQKISTNNGGSRSHRSSRHHNKTSENRKAGNTPPPSQTISGHARFSDLVKDTDKKDGPINWWGLTVRMPDDNTMNILSPHRIPVPQTPTTPGNSHNNLKKGALISSPTPKKQYVHRLSTHDRFHDEDIDQNNNDKYNNNTSSSSSGSANYHTPSGAFPDIDKPKKINIPQYIPYSHIPSYSNDPDINTSNISNIPSLHPSILNNTEYIIKDEDHGRVSAFDLDLNDPKVLKKYKITQEKKEIFIKLQKEVRFLSHILCIQSILIIT